MAKTHYHYTVSDLRQIVRMEDLENEIWYPADTELLHFDGAYSVELDDLHVALHTIIEEDLTLDAILRWWYLLGLSPLREWIQGLSPVLLNPFTLFEEDEPAFEFPENEEFALYDVWSILCSIPNEYLELNQTLDYHAGAKMTAIRHAEEYIDFYVEDQKLPMAQWVYPDFMNEAFIELFEDDDVLEDATPEERSRFVKCVDALAAKDNVIALNARCYGKYSGNVVYKQDFEGARNDAEKLFQLTEDPQYANTLGYIYYYGRCNHGEPEYEKALPYFMFGAFNGLVESTYKLADMYENGYGVMKSPTTAFRMMSMLFDDAHTQFLGGDEECPLADIALRLGRYYLHGIGVDQNSRASVYYLLVAEYAIKQRMEYDHYGDNVVAAHIRQCLAEAKKLMPPEKNKGKFYMEHYSPVVGLLAGGHRIAWKAKPLKNGDWSVTFQRLPRWGEEKPEKVFFSVPDCYYCTYTNMVKGHVLPYTGEMPTEGKADAISFGFEKGTPLTTLFYDENPVLELIGTSFEWHVTKPKKSGKMVTLAGVTFTPGGKQYDYLCDLPNIQEGDKVIVSGKGEESQTAIVQNLSTIPVEELIVPLEDFERIEGLAK